MEIEKTEVKNIVGVTNDKKIKILLSPCVGVEIQDNNIIALKLGNDIREYKFLEYKYIPKTIELNGECYDADRYEFLKVPIIVWTDQETGDKYIDLIKCHKTCIWKGQELIGMSYEYFIKEFNLYADLSEKQWSYGPYKNDRIYDLYHFYSLGLMLWVWRKKIRQILISPPEKKEEY